MPDAPETSPPMLPGLGLAAYVALLALICVVGVVGVSISWYSLVVGGQSLSPNRVSYGGLVDPAMLRPLRAAGLLGTEEMPDAFHAENASGTAACAIVGDKVVRLSPASGAQTILLGDIEHVSGGDGGVTVRSPTTTITCAFEAGEGGGSFKAMLDHRF